MQQCRYLAKVFCNTKVPASLSLAYPDLVYHPASTLYFAGSQGQFECQSPHTTGNISNSRLGNPLNFVFAVNLGAFLQILSILLDNCNL